MIKPAMEVQLLRLLASLPPRRPERLLTVIALTFIALGMGLAEVAKADETIPPSNPFAYCSAIGNIDMPPGGASPVAPALKPYLAKAFGLTADSAAPATGYYWRCMSGAVYVCAVGANIPCASKADPAKHNLGAERYCIDNPDAASVPAYATGHETIYRWSCAAGKAARGRHALKVDQRGFRVNLWHRVVRG
jgi:hypothetical protein